jgi:quercetin 2,3-dioxygenase
MKQLLDVHSAPVMHWVGDGFPVRSLFSYQNFGAQLSPFLLLDYAGPAEFQSAQRPKGVGRHPHRGFETVTIVYQGEVAHRDSTGQGGTIGPGDVQWMTAASGIIHEEFHSEAFTQAGGTLEMVQLWINLPAQDKMTTPGYQAILNAEIPQINLENGMGTLRTIAGTYLNTQGPARTFTPMLILDIRLNSNSLFELSVDESWNTALVVLKGSISVNGTETVGDAQLAVFEQKGKNFTVAAQTDAHLLLLSGKPIDEPIIGYGPFVMNTQAQIEQAISDFNAGHFGELS